METIAIVGALVFAPFAACAEQLPAYPFIHANGRGAVVHIKVRDLSKWKALMLSLLDKPNLDGFATAFDTSEREKIEKELMGEAIKAARARRNSWRQE